MVPVYINRIATAVPTHDVHRKFLDYAPSMLADERARRLFRRMTERADIEHRYSYIPPHPEPEVLDRIGFFRRGAFPDTATRMRFYEEHALRLALDAARGLGPLDGVTHLIVTSCTGFYAPGLDLQLMEHLGLGAGVERTLVGFMGCQAALPALKLAAHIVRSRPEARVLTVNLELCTIHLQETAELESILSFVIFADGCAASLVSAEPAGLRITGFGSAVIPESSDQISWHIRESGFLMWLDGARAGDDRARPAGEHPGPARRPPPERGRDLGRAPGRADDPGRGRGRARAGGGGARPVAASPARLRQHVVGDGDVRAERRAGSRLGRSGRAARWPSGPASRPRR